MAGSPLRHTVPDPVPSPGAADLAQLAVLVPAWQPKPLLISLVADLGTRGFGRLLVIDDGSSPAAAPLFEALATLPGVDLLRHATNRGKGRALKTGLAWLLRAHPELTGAVTADADGQHLASDIEMVARALLAEPHRPVLGTRGFAGPVPLRSRLGNTLTRAAFGLLTGARLADTQSGLRGLPRALFPELLTLPGERYEYETAMLAHLCHTGRTPCQVPISTVYLGGNRDSHFRPVLDSLRIYRTLLKMGFSYRSSQ